MPEACNRRRSLPLEGNEFTMDYLVVDYYRFEITQFGLRLTFLVPSAKKVHTIQYSITLIENEKYQLQILIVSLT